MPTLSSSRPFSNKEPRIRCPICGKALFTRNGTYRRAHPEQGIEVRVQRYRCKVPFCPRVTFSVLRQPFLPIVRHFYQTILFCQSLFAESQLTQAEGARRLGVTRGVVKRLCALVARVIPWLDHEKKIAAWGPDPTIHPDQFWVDFTRDFSQSFYPWRCWKIGPT